jgi:hypothetical protein
MQRQAVGDMLLEAAEAALRAGEEQVARRRLERAQRMMPRDERPLRLLEALTRGTPTPHASCSPDDARDLGSGRWAELEALRTSILRDLARAAARRGGLTDQQWTEVRRSLRFREGPGLESVEMVVATKGEPIVFRPDRDGAAARRRIIEILLQRIQRSSKAPRNRIGSPKGLGPS